MTKWTINLSLVTFTQHEVRRTHLVFQKKKFQGFISEILRVTSLLGEKLNYASTLNI